ncbi:sugar ABC transporter permease [Nonomuraea salmonea]|uniref:carbohydrate ABC transporter permease n=1 Tax=Nonomuraea salmonea TaxID=46181 RepID=UPI002FE9676F
MSVRTGSRRGYWLYLVPSLLLFLAVIVVPFVMNVGASFTRWSGVGTPRWIGLDNYTRLLADERFWESFQHNVGLIVAMAIVPTAIGLVLAAALFDYIGRRFGARTASALRAMYYLPQVLPVAVAGVVWGWMLHPSYGAVNQILGLDLDWLGDPDLALATVMGGSWCGSSSAIPSSSSWPGCSGWTRPTTRRPRSTGPRGGGSSGTSRSRRSGRRSSWCC